MMTQCPLLQARYGSPIVCLDLVKAMEKQPREIALRSEFDVAISYINQMVRACVRPNSRRAAHNCSVCCSWCQARSSHGCRHAMRNCCRQSL